MKTTYHFSRVQLLAIPFILAFHSCNTAQENTEIMDLVETENRFALLSKETNAKKAFEANLNDESIVFERGGAIVSGIEALKKWNANDSSYLLWFPLVADISVTNDLGYTTGPAEWGKWGPDRSKPKIAGRGFYATVWKKDKSGRWKIAVDLGSGLSDSTDRLLKPDFRSPGKAGRMKRSPGTTEAELLGIDHAYNSRLNEGGRSFIMEYLDNEATLLRSGERPFNTPEAIRKNIETEKDVKFSFMQAGGGIAEGCDLAYTYGHAGFELTQDGKEYNIRTNYLRVWKSSNGKWKIALEVMGR